MIRPQRIKTKFSDLAEAAFQRAAEDVVRIARQTGTPVLAYDENGKLESNASRVDSDDEDAPQDERR